MVVQLKMVGRQIDENLKVHWDDTTNVLEDDKIDLNICSKTKKTLPLSYIN